MNWSEKLLEPDRFPYIRRVNLLHTSRDQRDSFGRRTDIVMKNNLSWLGSYHYRLRELVKIRFIYRADAKTQHKLYVEFDVKNLESHKMFLSHDVTILVWDKRLITCGYKVLQCNVADLWYGEVRMWRQGYYSNVKVKLKTWNFVRVNEKYIL